MRRGALLAILMLLAGCGADDGQTVTAGPRPTVTARAGLASPLDAAEAAFADGWRPPPPPPPAPPPAPRRRVPVTPPRASRSRPPAARAIGGGTVWDQLAKCESGGNWAINTGNGYSGGLQMNRAFWQSYGGPAYAPSPHLATRDQQIAVAVRARDSGRGYHPWPTCARQLGLI